MCRLASVLCVCLLAAPSLRAQTTASGSVRGIATDPQGAVLPGVSISVDSATVPGIRTATTDQRGEFRVPELPPGEYTLTAELQGFSRFVRSPIAISAGLNVTVDVPMSVGAITETVEVRQETPLLESSRASQAVNISGEMLRAIPLSERREWFGALMLAPGVTTAQWVNNEVLMYVHGADSSANVVQIDGADMTPSLMGGVRYVSLNIDAIDDIQIKTAGIDASAPLGVGGIINIATASGTNRLKGTATVFVQPRAWNASNNPGGTSSTVDQAQADLSAGGPLVKNALWVFGSYRRVDANTGVSRTAAQLATLQALAPQYTPLDSTNAANLAFIKLNTQWSAAHRLEGFYQRDVNPVTFSDATTQYSRREATGGRGVSVRLSSVWSDHLTTRAGASFNDKRRDGQDPGIGGPLQIVYSSTIASAGRLAGNGRLANLGSPVTAWNGQPNSKLTLSFDSTFLATTRTGSHELQTGLYAQPRTRIGLTTSYVNGGYVLEETTLRRPGAVDSGIVPFHRITFDGTGLTNAQRVGQDYAIYIQDAWRPTTQLTINAGVRLDRIDWTDQLFDITSQTSTEVGPRFGLNYAITSDAHHILRAHWVKVHDQPSLTAVSVGTVSLTQRDAYDLNLDGVFETTFVTPATLAVTPARSIDPDLHQPFVEDWGAGYTQQFRGRTTAGIDVVRRDYRDRPTLLETNGRYNGKVFTGYINEAFNQIYLLTNNRWNTPVYTSVELSATKRTNRIQAVGSYVRQWRHIDGTWQPNDPASFIQPAAFANDRGIGSPIGATASPDDANSLSGTNMSQAATASAQWQDHVARAGATYRAAWGLQLSSSYTFQSGAWSGPVVSQGAADPAFGPPTLTLSNGRVVSNPLATTIRFAYPTRADGQVRTARLHVWNVRVGRQFIVNHVKLDAALDMFNLTNNGADQSFMSGANQTYNPLYGLTNNRQLPRSAQVLLRVGF
ncbi:MAG: TonB-dependent receptor plug [Acidobacteria bacterium]|nr:TonB-dependent receptor plug [Acidobacteriota bacterium]